jgi:hypothetical protein
MKKNYISIFGLLALLLCGVLWSCSEDSDVNGGKPNIIYVRVTNAEAADSLIESGYQGATIAIIGENLQSVRQVWFNDREANLNPTFITSGSVIVTIPSRVPETITNKLAMIFANGDTVRHDFEVAISAPTITSMDCEYVLPGTTATIRGDFFYKPLTVIFNGGVEGTVTKIEDNKIEVTVPDNAIAGPITVTTNFGKETSDFWFMDNRNIVISSDPFTGWWQANFVVSNPGAGDPVAINGNYIRVSRAVSSWSWLEVAGGPASAMGDISKNFPSDAILNSDKYYLKFEVNTVKPYNSNMIKFNFGLQSENNDSYLWAPPLDTKGAWRTIAIPLDEIFASYEAQGVTPIVNTDGYWTRVLLHGNGDLDCDIAFDNFRIVPKKL